MDTDKLHPRVQTAIAAKDNLANDFFGGWCNDDIKLFNKYHYKTDTSPGSVTDYFGFKTPVNFIPWASHLGGITINEPPIPDDGVRAEAIEYIAVLTSLERASKESYTIVELGASYAPWAAFASTLAKRSGRVVINAVAVEAGSFFLREIPSIFKLNNLSCGETGGNEVNINLKVLHGAVSKSPGTFYFPKVTGFDQNGGQAVNTQISVDYVGREIIHESSPCVTLEMIFSELPVVDLVHCDIQGAELEVLTSSINLIKRKVRSIFIGTHSRYIEGCLLDEFHKNGFELSRERPCLFQYNKNLFKLEGMTTRDGGQFWINSNLV